jgi:hypothetical protein
MRAYAGVFETMDFPEYKFQEYPKVVGYRDAGKTLPIIVQNRQEEDDFLAAPPPEAFSSAQDRSIATLERQLADAQARLAELDAAVGAKAKAVVEAPTPDPNLSLDLPLPTPKGK